MANEIELNEKIRELIQTNGLPSQDDLKQIIKDLLMYMKHEEMSVSDKGLGHEPIFNSDFPGDDDPSSLFKRINWRADLDEGEGALDFDALLGNDTALGNYGIWNESVKELIKYFKDYFVNLDEDKTITVSGKEANGASVSNSFYIIRNILKANAGNHFKMVEGKDASSNKWTLPHLNIDNKSYGVIRGNDKILEVLESAKNLDFTHTQDQVESTTQDDSAITKYIRLLMPKYIRRVEVEDLNRNFWVIGQVLSIVCAALFDDNSPIPQMLKKLSSETLQLWENVMYLWAAVNLLNEKQGETPEPTYEIHYEVIDYPRAEDKPYRDINFYTNVPNFEGGTDFPGRLESYKKLYPNSNLCLLLRCRLGNYEKDYYHTEVYPYIVYYNRYEDKWSYTQIQVTMNGIPRKLGFTLRIDSDVVNGKEYNYLDLRDYSYAFREDTSNNYYHYFPIKDMPPNTSYVSPVSGRTYTAPQDALGAHNYYGIIKISPTIKAKIENKKIVVTTLKFQIEDIARKLHYLGNEIVETGHSVSEYDRPLEDQFVDDDRSEIKYYMRIVNYNVETLNENTETIRRASPLADGTFVNTYTYNNRQYSIPEHDFKEINIRDSGFQGSLCDMITYRGVSRASGT